MKISTKKGDDGTSTLSEAGRIPKNDMRFNCLGDVDELNAQLGLAKVMLGQDLHEEKAFIEGIQHKLITIGGHIYNMEKPDYFLTPEDTQALEAKISAMEGQYTFKGFVLPGGTALSAQLDVCRTIARRCERDLVAVSQQYPVDVHTRTYMNRLSDFLYMYARIKAE